MSNTANTEDNGSNSEHFEYDEIQKRVLIALNAVESGNRADIIAAYEGLGPLDVSDVIAELTLWMEDLTEDISVGSLVAAAVLPLPSNPEDLAQAIINCDVVGMQDAVGSDQLDTILASLLVLVAGLKDSRVRIIESQL